LFKYINAKLNDAYTLPQVIAYLYFYSANF